MRKACAMDVIISLEDPTSHNVFIPSRAWTSPEVCATNATTNKKEMTLKTVKNNISEMSMRQKYNIYSLIVFNYLLL